MVGRKEGECCFATNLPSYKVNHFPIWSGFPGRGQERSGPRDGVGVSPEPAGAAPPSRRGLPAPRLPTASGPHLASRCRAPAATKGAHESGDEPWDRTVLRVGLSVCLPLLPPSEGHLCSPPPFPLPERESWRAEGALSRGSTVAAERLSQISAPPSPQRRGFSEGQGPLLHAPPNPHAATLPHPRPWLRLGHHWPPELRGWGD